MAKKPKTWGYYTFERCQTLAKKFKTKSKFKEKEPSAYTRALKYKWLDKICSHMISRKKWTKESLLATAKKFKTKSEFKEKEHSGYVTAVKKKCLDEICSHMIRRENWTFKLCKEEAEKYSTRTKFYLESRGAYLKAKRNKWLDKICVHMKIQLKWPRELVEIEAEKYKSKMDFLEGSGGAYHRALKEGYLEDICNHMDEGRNPNGFWTKSRIEKEAKKYETRTKFSENSSAAATIAKNNGWMDDVCGHMKVFKKPRGYWTFERCEKEAKKYKTRSEFKNKSPREYTAAQRKGWLDKICSHMERAGSHVLRAIYEIYDEKRNLTYIGLSYNPEKRYLEHFTKSSNLEKLLQGNHKLQILTDFLPINESALEEIRYIDQRESDGWTVLNISKGGSLGGDNLYWTLSLCIKKANECNTKTKFRNKWPGAYGRAHKEGFLNEICTHMEVISKPSGYWTKELCWEEAKKYKTRSEFKRKSGAAYRAAQKKGWLKIICNHMVYKCKPSGYWTFERCKKEAKKYKSRTEFEKKGRGAYSASLKNKWMNEICGHMKDIHKPSGYWTFERCKKEAEQYKTRGEFVKKNPKAYNASLRNKWMNKICGHMKEIKKPNGYWTFERCKKEAKKYKSRTEFAKKGRGAYDAAVKFNWLDKICGHLKGLRRRVRCIETGEVFTSLREAGKGKGFNPKHIGDVCSGKRNLTGGYRWDYV